MPSEEIPGLNSMKVKFQVRDLMTTKTLSLSMEANNNQNMVLVQEYK